MSAIKIAECNSILQSTSGIGEVKGGQDGFEDLLFDIIDTAQESNEKEGLLTSEITDFISQMLPVGLMPSLNTIAENVSVLEHTQPENAVVNFEQNNIQHTKAFAKEIPTVGGNQHQLQKVTVASYELPNIDATGIDSQNTTIGDNITNVSKADTVNKNNNSADKFIDNVILSKLDDVYVAQKNNSESDKQINLMRNMADKLPDELKKGQQAFERTVANTGIAEKPMHEKKSFADDEKAITSAIKDFGSVAVRDIKHSAVYRQLYYRRAVNTDLGNEHEIQYAKKQFTFEQAKEIDTGQKGSINSEISAAVFDTEKAESVKNDHEISLLSHNSFPKTGNLSADSDRKSIVVEKVPLENVFNEVTKGLALDAKGDKKQITLVLTPENLGTIKMQVSSDESGITAHIITDNLSVMDEIQNQSADLKEILSGQGFKLNSIEVRYKENSDNASLFAGFNQQKEHSRERKNEQKVNYRMQKTEEKSAIASMLNMMTEGSAGLNYLA